MKIKETIHRYGKTYVPATKLHANACLWNGEISTRKLIAGELKFIFQRKFMRMRVEPPQFLLPSRKLLVFPTIYYSCLFMRADD